MKSRISSSVERDASATSELVRSSVMMRTWPRFTASGDWPRSLAGHHRLRARPHPRSGLPGARELLLATSTPKSSES